MFMHLDTWLLLLMTRDSTQGTALYKFFDPWPVTEVYICVATVQGNTII